ncbi:hypothetical protein T265_01450 [Opisthorchis viverrini]|uniref:Uncharacterized protein n=1 Tax=Opisthorchis viverrini TaxID=6198 RepID=A0A075A9Z6_OPIVI|nr:hypothetical protein T265_01450 [Opisthorchis viverrini]KER32580.1 hypothetical protein T265_01450 [Opisthorchis viverrini]
MSQKHFWCLMLREIHDELLRKRPKPVLDLVPYDPAIVPPSFRSATKEEDEDESTVVSSNNIPTASSTEVMEAEVQADCLFWTRIYCRSLYKL